MAASRICHGVWKSGSPMPSEMTSFIDWTISKKSRIPERGIVRTWLAICFLRIIGRSAWPGRVVLRRHGEPLGSFLSLQSDAIFLVGFESEMCRRRNDALDGAQFLRDERRHLLEGVTFDDHEQIVAAAHEITALHLCEPGNACGEPIKSATSFRRNAHFDNRRNRCPGELLRIDHCQIAENHAVAFQFSNLTDHGR